MQEMFVKGVRGSQPADECECRYVLIAIGDVGQLALKVTDVIFEAITLSHYDGKKTVVVPLNFRRDLYWMRNALETSSKLWREHGGRE